MQSSASLSCRLTTRIVLIDYRGERLPERAVADEADSAAAALQLVARAVDVADTHRPGMPVAARAGGQVQGAAAQQPAGRQRAVVH